MNMAPPTVRPTRANAEPTRILVIGTRDGIRETIDHLCALTFCDHAEWSTLQPKPDSPGTFLSTMTKWRI
jgi:hypothetical protein